MKLYLHIGAEKTGTSTIQEVLFQNKKLLSACGHHFLQCAGRRNAKSIPAYAVNDGHFEQFFRRHNINTSKNKHQFKRKLELNFDEELSNMSSHINSVIISSEHLHSRTPTVEEIERLASLFRRYFTDVEVICYVRNQVACLHSRYSSSLKAGYTGTLEELAGSCKPSNIYYNYYEMLLNWRTVFGPENINVRLFDKKYLVQGNVVDDFLEQLNLNDKTLHGIDTNINCNESINTNGQHIIRLINKAIPKYKLDGSDNITRRKLARTIAKNFSGKGRTMNTIYCNEIFDSFRESNKKLNEFFLGLPEACFENIAPGDERGQKFNLSESDALKLIDAFSFLAAKAYPKLPNKFAYLFRDAALSHEDENLRLALRIMETAKKIKPRGPLINRKIKEWTVKLKQI